MSEEHRNPPDDSGQKTRGVFTRRRFLQGVALTASTTALSENGVLGARPPASAAAAKQGPEAGPVALTVNGKRYGLTLEPRVTLLDALRNHTDVNTNTPVDLTGTKRVCDRGSCGACTVIIEGRTVYSCSMLAIEAQGKNITTVEGLGEEGKPDPVQEAFVECDGLMCGFCTPGFVVSSKNLLDQNPHPSPSQVRRALNGNICRCGTYAGVFKAVELASTRKKGG